MGQAYPSLGGQACYVTLPINIRMPNLFLSVSPLKRRFFIWLFWVYNEDTQ